jgi:nucleoside-diphosphate-sugar epimerase
MPGRFFLTGGTGFVGKAVIEALVARGYSVNALTNHRPIEVGGDRVQSIPGGLFDQAAIQKGMAGCDGVIHLVGIIMEKKSKGITFNRIHYEGTRSIVDAARAIGIKRYVQMSALGSRADAQSSYHKTKFRAEEYVRQSGLDWTIFRPSMIHGPRGEFMQMEAAWARKQKPPFLFMPYFGRGLFGSGGAGRLQPVYVNDVARAFVDALENPRAIGEVFPLGGPDVVTWPRMHQTVAEAVTGHKRLVVPLPAWYAKMIAAITPASLLPFNRDQVIMSQEDNTCDMTKFKEVFGWEPQPFAATVQGYAAQL